MSFNEPSRKTKPTHPFAIDWELEHRLEQEERERKERLKKRFQKPSAFEGVAELGASFLGLPPLDETEGGVEPLSLEDVVLSPAELAAMEKLLGENPTDLRKDLAKAAIVHDRQAAEPYFIRDSEDFTGDPRPSDRYADAMPPKPAAPPARRPHPLPSGGWRSAAPAQPIAPSSRLSPNWRWPNYPTTLPVPSERKQPEPKSGEPRLGRDAGFYSSLASGFTSDEEELVRYLAMHIYPKEPLEKSINRFRKVDNDWVHDADDGISYYALPPGLASEITGLGGEAIPVLAALGTGWATKPFRAIPYYGPAIRTALIEAAIGGSEILRQWLGDQMLGRAATPGLNDKEIRRKMLLYLLE